ELDAALDNRGTLTVSSVGVVNNKGSAVQSNTGTIDLTSGNFTLNESGANANFTNAGTMTIGPDHTLTVNNGGFTQSAGTTLVGGGTLALNNVTLQIDSDLSNAGLALKLSSVTINGAATVSNAPGQSLTLINTTVNTPLLNH